MSRAFVVESQDDATIEELMDYIDEMEIDESELSDWIDRTVNKEADKANLFGEQE